MTLTTWDRHGSMTTNGTREQNRDRRRVVFTTIFSVLGTVVGTNAACAPRSSLVIWTPGDWTGNFGSEPSAGEQRLLPQAPDALREIRRRTNLTWSEISEVLGVDRRTLHLWAAGHGIRSQNADALFGLLTAVRNFDLGRPEETKNLVLESFTGSPRIVVTDRINFRPRVQPRLSQAQRRNRRSTPRLADLASPASVGPSA
jgi:transcriptional regulator with XRE-family HTH domain